MRGTYRRIATATALLALTSVSSADRVHMQQVLLGQNQDTSLPADKPPAGLGTVPPAMVLDTRDVEGILGKEVRSSADESMGRIINVVVDRAGQPRAAIIDFGGFLGVGNRQIAVDWSLLHFEPTKEAGPHIVLELTRDQVKAAPEYKDGKPVVVLGALGDLQSWPFENSGAPK